VDNDPYPFGPDSFDAIFAGEVIEHLNNPDHFLEETHRILRRKGLLVITTPNLASWYNRIALLLGFEPYWLNNSYKYPYAGQLFKRTAKAVPQAGRHSKLYTRRALTELLALYGFSIFQSSGYPYPLEGKLYPLFNLLDKLMDPFGASSGIIIGCNKN
jgi:2-polyprenyl-3-methyl-5-hydroxy-6-metoxy-1,4-benzoquinol methylase